MYFVMSITDFNGIAYDLFPIVGKNAHRSIMGCCCDFLIYIYAEL